MPGIEGQISATGRVIQGLAALIAFGPAVALLFDLVDVPPKLIDLIKVLSFFITLAVVIVIALLTDAIAKLKPKVAGMLVLAAVLLGSASATGYYFFAESHMIAVQRGDETERYVLPIDPSPRLRELVEPFGGYEQAIYVSARKNEILREIDRQNLSAVVVMLLLLVAANVLLVSAVVGGAWKVAQSL